MSAPEDLSEEDELLLQDIFDLFDANNDGHIDVTELGKVLRAFGKDITKTQLDSIFNSIDQDKNGKLEIGDLKVFIKHMKHNPNDYRDDLRAAFKALDKNGDNYIDRNELIQICTTLGEDPLTIEQAQEMISFVDVDGDGKINLKEFEEKFIEADNKLRDSLGHKKHQAKR